MNATKGNKLVGIEGKRAIYGYVFALPWMLGLLIFYLYPLISSVVYSFTDYNGVMMTKFVGATNYVLLFNDRRFWTSVYNTLFFAALNVPIGLIFGVTVAMLINVKTKAQGLYRVLCFLPTLVPAVASAVIWQWLLNGQFGVVNYFLYSIGVPNPPAWFGSATWAKPAMAIMSQWGIGTTILTYLGGLQDIPSMYYEAATIDGAGALTKFRNITLPLLTPVLFFNLVMSIIGSFQQFTLPFLISPDGTPADAMLYYGMYLYRNAFSYLKMGLANSMAWIMFIIVMGLTVFIYGTSGKWVHYMSGE